MPASLAGCIEAGDRLGRQVDPERRRRDSVPGAGGGEPAAVGLDHRPADRQAEPEAAIEPLPLAGPSARTR